MKITGIILTAIGIVFLIFMFLPAFVSDLIPRGGLPWTFTWGAILGIFFFFSGFALLLTPGDSREDRYKKERL